MKPYMRLHEKGQKKTLRTAKIPNKEKPFYIEVRGKSWRSDRVTSARIDLTRAQVRSLVKFYDFNIQKVEYKPSPEEQADGFEEFFKKKLTGSGQIRYIMMLLGDDERLKSNILKVLKGEDLI